MKTWHDKAKSIIERLCRDEYLKTKNSKLSYRVPVDAEFLIDCLNRNDEEAAKAHFIRLESVVR